MKFDKYTILIILGAILIMIGSILENQRLSRQRDTWEHNYRVLQDSVNIIETKYGETLFENGSLIIKKKELEDALDISKKEVKEYEKKMNSSLAYIARLENQLKIKDTVTITEFVHDTLTNSFTTNYRSEWLNFDQDISFLSTNSLISKTYNIEMNVPLKVGLTEDYQIFVTSPNPYFKATNIEGAVIDGSKFAPKPKRLSIGLYGGLGLGYGLINKQIDIGPQIGGGITYKIF